MPDSLRDQTQRGDPFWSPADVSDPWQQRLDWLQARAHRPLVCVRGTDLALLLTLYRAVSKQAYLAERHNNQLRDEVAMLEAELVAKHSAKWEVEEAA